MASDQRVTLAFLPAVAVSCGRGDLYLTIVASVTDASAFGAAAQGTGQSTSSALENVLKKEQINCQSVLKI